MSKAFIPATEEDRAAIVDAAGNAALNSAPQDPHVSYTRHDREAEDEVIKVASSRLWLVSFSDLCSLMLCFFVLLFSTKDPDIAKLSAMLGGAYIQGAQSGAGEAESAGKQAGANINRTSYGEALNLDYLQSILKNALSQTKLQDDVRLVTGRDHLKLLIEGDKVFEGNAALNAQGKRIAQGLAGRLQILSNRITLMAYPDDDGDLAAGLAAAQAFAEGMRDGGYRKTFTVLAQPQGRGPSLEIRVESDDGHVQ